MTDPVHTFDAPEPDAVFHLDADLNPVAMSTPCPGVANGPFINSDATWIRCGHLAGHEGACTWGVTWRGNHAH